MNKIVTVTLPDIGEGVVEGEVIQWLKQPGDALKQDEPVVIVMTDKATVELPSPHPGKLAKQHVAAGQVAHKDKPLYDIDVEGEVVQAPLEKSAAKTAETPPKKASSRSPAKIAPTAKQGSIHPPLATPHTRQLAHELGIDLSQVPPTGRDEHITSDDVVRAHAGKQVSPATTTPPLQLPGDTEMPLIGIRHLMANAMEESRAHIPHFSYFEQLDATRLVQLRQRYQEEASKQGVAVTFMPFILRALSLTLTRYPAANSSLDWERQTLILHPQHNIGIAMVTPNGLVVPVLKGVEKMSLQELIRAYEELKKRTRANQLHPSDMKEATITISNFGVLGGGGLWATPIIHSPEVAILALAKIHKQPVVRNEEVVIRDVLNVSWSFDHRVIDGELAATVSHHLSTLLQNPAACT